MIVQQKQRAVIRLIVHFVAIHGLWPQAPQVRPARFDDFFRNDARISRDFYGSIGAIELSPDGKYVAYVADSELHATKERPFDYVASNGSMPIPFDTVDPAGDVWVASVDGSERRNITHGERDGAGFWAPQWTPDGQALVMLSTRGGELRYWEWDRSSSQMRRLVRPDLQLGLRPIQWLSNREMLVAGIPDTDAMVPPVLGTAGSRATTPGFKVSDSMSVLDAGVPDTGEQLPKIMAVRVNVATGTETTVAEGIGLLGLTASPSKQRLIFALERHGGTFDPNRMVHWPTSAMMPGHTLQIVGKDLATTSTVRSFAGLPELSGTFGIAWSSDSSQFIVLAADSGTNGHFYRCQYDEESCTELRTIETGILNNPDADGAIYTRPYLLWFGDHRVLIHGRLRSEVSNGDSDIERWGTLDDDNEWHPLSNEGITDWTHLWQMPDESGFIAIVDGLLERFDPHGRYSSTLSSPSTGAVTAFAGVSFGTPDEFTRDKKPLFLAFEATDATKRSNQCIVNLSTGQIVKLQKPSQDAEVAALDIASGLTVFRDANGIWSQRRSQDGFTKLASQTPFYGGISDLHGMTFSYLTTDGKRVGAQLLFPPGYRTDKRYPMVVVVYPNTQFDASAEGKTISEHIRPASVINDQLLAIHGYVVLRPSMPGFGTTVSQDLKELSAQTQEPYFTLANGVLPAIDEAVRRGIADTDRIGLIGHSYGGYAVYGLVTQSQRFKAAVAASGFSDLTSFYGAFDARLRYSPNGNRSLFYFDYLESVLRMGGPPWEDMERYVRNSPIYHANSVTTPVMIVQGDMDYISIEQGEEFFSALERQGKRVKFVRYWGEGHVLESSVALRDYWERVYDWFDRYLQPPMEPTRKDLPQ